ncbi:M24 family metallopeptidase [Paraglaciecola arctica]|uniref:Xaa-Pro dipeptidase n=1 Tax=Paraglaciecola arctica BSs20135 TaxID=493475 RepID=K6XE02_9ALTE|nr:Xaa-Pro peptidase family protein [Paraglaciecola arctica]GAC18854.1 Xaa-Pro dipeptidase [Paraglaciecola arctica BSs20135]
MNTHVIGGKTPQQALDSLHNMTADVSAIEEAEYRARLVKAQTYMQQHEIAAIYLNAGTNLAYFTGTHWGASERLVGAILPAYGEVQYLVPIFEIATLQEYMSVTGPVHGWHEHECPYELFIKVLAQLQITTHAKIAMDESSPFFIFDGINQLQSGHTIVNGKAVTAHCRMTKSPHELTLIQRAMDMTLEVHKAVASILYAGISTLEVAQFINQAHQKVGASGSYFCIVLFGEATAYPHGVKNPQLLQDGDMVLVDTGCKLQGYTSDITRTYVYGQASQRQREVWQYEKQAQAAAFNAAQLGVTCEDVDNAARQSLEANGLGPGYAIPGLPHRTGHGIGMDIHEWPYLVGGNLQPLEAGMCFSNEPMICIPGEFGVRLEDHFYITEQGPRWFTQPSHNIDNPFG